MIHHVFANKSNIGDWLSALGIQKLLAPEPVVEHLCDEPFVHETLSALAGLTKNDLLIIGGGGLFMDYFETFWRGLAELDLKAPLVIWGVGYCDLKDEPSHPPIDLLRSIVDRAALCCVRDGLTIRLLNRHDLAPPSGCPSLCVIEPPPTSENFGLLHVDNYTTVGAAAYDAMTAAGEQFARDTGRVYRTTNNRLQRGGLEDLHSHLQRYARSDLVISSALHGCIIAAGMGKKVLAVSGDFKIEQFMESIGLADWVLTQQQALDAALLKRRISELPTQSLDRSRLDDIRRQQRDIAERVKRLLVKP